MKLQPSHFNNVDRAVGRVLQLLGPYTNDSDFKKRIQELVKNDAEIHDLNVNLKYLQNTTTTLMLVELV